MDKNTCPICNKIGIPDFLSKDVVCPCCDSDLSIYRKLNQSQPNEQISKRLRYVIPISLSMLAVGIFTIFWGYHVQSSIKKEYNNQYALAQKDFELVKLSEKITELSLQVEMLSTSQTKESIWYTVKAGDSFCRISRAIYGKEDKYKTIINLNNLTESTILHPGDYIRVK